MLRVHGPQRYFWDELQAVNDMEFRFDDKSDNVDYVEDCSLNLHLYRPEDVLTGESLYVEYDHNHLAQLLSYFTPTNCRISLSSKDGAGHPFVAAAASAATPLLTEPWFGTLYCSMPFPPAMATRWADTTRTDPSFHLPNPNPFIPTDFTLVTPQWPEVGVTSMDADPSRRPQQPWAYPAPAKLLDEEHGVVWHKGDALFQQPRVKVHLHLESPAAHTSPRAAVITNLFCALFKESLNEFYYMATMGGSEYSFSPVRAGLDIKIFGFSDKIMLLLSKIIERLVAVEFTVEQFAIHYENMQRFYAHMHYDAARYAETLRLMTEQSLRYPAPLLREAIATVTLADVNLFRQQLLSSFYLTMFAHGNITPEKTIEIYQQLRQRLAVSFLCVCIDSFLDVDVFFIYI